MPESSGRGWWARPKHTTQLSQSPPEFVTITHPYHPLRGQQVEVIRIRQGADPDFIIRYPDGTHAAIAMSSTNYAHSAVDDLSTAPSQLLALQGLRQAARLIEHFRQQAGATTVDTSLDMPGATRYDKAP